MPPSFSSRHIHHTHTLLPHLYLRHAAVASSPRPLLLHSWCICLRAPPLGRCACALDMEGQQSKPSLSCLLTSPPGPPHAASTTRRSASHLIAPHRSSLALRQTWIKGHVHTSSPLRAHWHVAPCPIPGCLILQLSHRPSVIPCSCLWAHAHAKIDCDADLRQIYVPLSD